MCPANLKWFNQTIAEALPLLRFLVLMPGVTARFIKAVAAFIGWFYPRGFALLRPGTSYVVPCITAVSALLLRTARARRHTTHPCGVFLTGKASVSSYAMDTEASPEDLIRKEFRASTPCAR